MPEKTAALARIRLAAAVDPSGAKHFVGQSDQPRAAHAPDPAAAAYSAVIEARRGAL
jgi:hypothetical protein